jgi:hypothetical protein
VYYALLDYNYQACIEIHISKFYTQWLSSQTLPTSTNKHTYVVNLESSFLTYTNKHTTYTQVNNKYSRQVKQYRYSGAIWTVWEIKYRQTTSLLGLKFRHYCHLVLLFILVFIKDRNKIFNNFYYISYNFTVIWYMCIYISNIFYMYLIYVPNF